ncbi:MAG: hypothetical protein ACTFAK_14355 [Candidatus Electronema sp. VV]
MCDDFLYHHNVLTHHFLFYHYQKFHPQRRFPIAGNNLVRRAWIGYNYNHK